MLLLQVHVHKVFFMTAVLQFRSFFTILGSVNRTSTRNSENLKYYNSAKSRYGSVAMLKQAGPVSL